MSAADVRLLARIRDIAEAERDYPESLCGQQAHFGVTLPRMRELALQSISHCLSRAERETLLDLLKDSLEIDE